jgi:hypothetical protein
MERGKVGGNKSENVVWGQMKSEEVSEVFECFEKGKNRILE